MITEQSYVLVVDDNRDVRELLAARLERRGYAVETAVNGRHALEIIQKTSFDLILLDIMMPEMNGYETLEQLQANPTLRHIPVIILSALDDMNSIVKCIELGADDYLFKPINSALLWARITASLEKKHLRDQERARLTELSILQQIDQELNTNLDETKVAQIVLKWAMRQTRADAGLFAMVADNQLRVRAANNLEGLNPVLSCADLTADEAMANGRIQRNQISPGTGLLTIADHRVLVPIQREGAVRGLLLLEKLGNYASESLNFLSRLGDHAAIALNNAQLFGQLQAANRAKSNFVGLVAHELKSSLASIKLYGDLILKLNQSLPSGKQTKYITAIQDAVERMHGLIIELDDITRIETGKMRLDAKSVSLISTVKKAREQIDPQIAAKKQTLTIAIPPDLPSVLADHKRLLQILNNLMNNAHKYTLEGGHIQVSAALKTQDERDVIQVAVQDNGLGIDRQDQPLIFSQFFRSSDMKIRARSGAGLGLNITKQIVELQGGQIWFESEFRQGTTFYFTLPATDTAVAETGSA